MARYLRRVWTRDQSCHRISQRPVVISSGKRHAIAWTPLDGLGVDGRFGCSGHTVAGGHRSRLAAKLIRLDSGHSSTITVPRPPVTRSLNESLRLAKFSDTDRGIVIRGGQSICVPVGQRPELVPKYIGLAKYHRALKEKYEHAALDPRLPVEPDPAPPVP